MITLFRAPQIVRFSELKDQMAHHIRQLPQQITFVGTPTRILRFELPCQPIDILAWLHNNQLQLQQLYWSDREEAFESGGIDICDQIHGEGTVDHAELFDYMEQRLSPDNPRLRFYGGLRFHNGGQSTEWRHFGSYRFVIPRFELTRTQDQFAFAVNVAIQQAEEEQIAELLRALDQISFEPMTQYRGVPRMTARLDRPDRREWEEMFLKLKRDRAHTGVEKIVLARKTVFDFDTDIRPMALLKHLKDMTRQCFHFCLQTGTNEGFLGASPERLFKRTGTEISTEAIAGTTRRGGTREEDERLAEALLDSSKDRHEHRFVVEDLAQKLSQLCGHVEGDKTSTLLKLDSNQHLLTRLQGRLNARSTDDAILKLLHPTPAVAGTPAEAALAAIHTLEPFDRGWYAGPVGYVGWDHAEFAVAIRSALVNGHSLSLYAGAGIVDESTAQGEWDEIEDKIGSFLKVFER